jgi:hypothetical protein
MVSLTIFFLVGGLGVKNLVKFLTFRKEWLLCESYYVGKVVRYGLVRLG